MGERQFLTVFAAVSLHLGVAHAEGEGVVRLGGACMPPETSIVEVVQILRAELAPRSVQLVGEGDALPGTNDVLLAVDECTTNPAGARVTVLQHGERSALRVGLVDAAPGTVSRTFALALAETIRRAFAEPQRESFTLAPATPLHVEEPSPSRPGSGAPTPEHAPRATGALLFRFASKTATPSLGVAFNMAWNRLGAGVLALGTEHSTSLGRVDLFALAAQGFADFVEMTPVFRLRAAVEAGVAVADGSPHPGVTGLTQAGLHAGASLGVAAVLPLDSGFDLEAFVAGAYASSLAAETDRREPVSLGGFSVCVSAGVRFP